MDPIRANVLNTQLARQPNGSCQVQWLAITQDGNRTRGRYRFTVL